ncbi:hypothetical protein D9M70_417260 [compost metagenome]
MRHRRQRQQIDDRQRDQCQRHFERVERMPLAIFDQGRRDQPGDRRGDRRAGERQCQTDCQLARRRKGFEHVEEAERRHRCSSNAADEADDDGRMQVGNEDVHQRYDDEADDADFGKAAQPVLSANLHQRDRQADIGRHVSRRQPTGLDRGRRERTLDLRQIGKRQVHAQALRQEQENRPDDIDRR